MRKLLQILGRLWGGSPSPAPPATDPPPKAHVANVCGHATNQSGKVTNPFGEEGDLQMPLADNGHPDYCLECVAAMSVRCAWCGKSIDVGDPVTLYVPKESFVAPDYAVRHEEGGHVSLVGCLRWECASSGADRQGFWYPPGKVKRVPSPVELALASPGGMSSVFVPDVSDPRNLGVVTPLK